MFIPQSIKRTAFPALLVERLRGTLVSIPSPPDKLARRQPKLSALRSAPEMSQGCLRRMAGRLKAEDGLAAAENDFPLLSLQSEISTFIIY
jgi:hypothetical protein